MANKNDDVFIKRYETIRQMLLQLFVYGCYNREQGAARQMISSSYYSENLKRIKYFWPQKIESDRTSTGKKINRFPLNQYKDTENYLLRSYEIKAFSAQDLNLYVFILQALADSNEKTIAEIQLDIENCVYTDEDTNLNYQMLQAKLKEMAQVGFLLSGTSVPITYRLTPNFLESFHTDELLHLNDLISLYRDILPLSSLGYHCQQVIQDYITYFLGDDVPAETLLGASDIFYQEILNDEIFFQLTTAIEHRKKITFQLTQHNEIFLEATPISLLFDREYGRQFLFGSTATGEFFIRRLDYITNIQILDKTAAPIDTKQINDILDSIWSSSLKFTKGTEPCHDVNIDFFWNNKQQQDLQQRLIKECHHGSIDILSDHHWLFRIAVTDPTELIPWIRSFGHCAHVRPSTAHRLAAQLQKEQVLLQKIYHHQKQFPVNKSTIRQYGPQKQMQLSSASAENPVFFTEFRSPYFRAIIQLYARILLSGETFTPAALRQYLSTHAFPLPKDARKDDRIAHEFAGCSKDIKRLSLWKKSLHGENLLPAYQQDEEHVPLPPCLLMTIEKRWLSSLLQQPLAPILLGNTLLQKLEQALSTEPFPWNRILIERGCQTPDCSPQNPKLLSRITQLITVLQQKGEISYQLMSDSKTYIGRPIRLSYSPYRCTYQLLLITPHNQLQQISIEQITHVQTSNEISIPSVRSIPCEPEPIHLIIRPIHEQNDIERCFLLFSTSQKQGWYDEYTGLYHLNIYYHHFEQENIIRCLLSLGAAVFVAAPASFQQKIQSCLQP